MDGNGDGWFKSTYCDKLNCVEVAFVKSSYSAQDNCVEVGVARKSSHSDVTNCVEVEGLPEGHVAVRDSKNPGGPMLQFTPNEWDAFLKGVRDGEFDLPDSSNAPVGEKGHGRE